MLTVPWLTARETAALIVVAVSLLFFRVFRERCLLLWGAGWIAYGVFLWATSASELHRRLEVDGGIRAGRLCAGDGVVCGGGADVGAVAANADGADGGLLGADGLRRHAAVVFSDTLYFRTVFSESNRLGLGLEVACRLIAAGAAIELLRYRWGRIGLGPFLFGAGLLTLNLHWPPFTSHIPSEGYLLAEVLFGSSMLAGGAGRLARCARGGWRC